MNTTISNNTEYPGTHDLLVDGHVYIESESMVVCSNWKESIDRGGLSSKDRVWLAEQNSLKG